MFHKLNILHQRLLEMFLFLHRSTIIASHVITKSSIMFAKYLPFWQLHVVEFQI